VSSESLAGLYKRHRFPAEVIVHCVWLYHRFGLSLRDVQELMAERGDSRTFTAGLLPAGAPDLHLSSTATAPFPIGCRFQPEMTAKPADDGLRGHQSHLIGVSLASLRTRGMEGPSIRFSGAMSGAAQPARGADAAGREPSARRTPAATSPLEEESGCHCPPASPCS